MKKITIKSVMFLAAASLLTFGFSGSALAFHNGGVAHCDGCHTMHNSMNGAPVVTGPAIVGSSLTKGTDPSSTCLNCHNGASSYKVKSTDGSNFKPGGDFYWLSKTYSWGTRGQNTQGDDHGHNIVAEDFTMLADATLSSAPGGSYPSTALGCTSCHDPHGRKNGPAAQLPITVSGSYGGVPLAGTIAGNYRLLGGNGYFAGDGVTFAVGAPVALAPSTSAVESDTLHVDYKSGMSEFCGNCHGGFSGSNKHPAGSGATLGSTISTNYNSYVRTGTFTGVATASYLALVPFERGAAFAGTLSTTTTQGPASAANVMCLTCHRSHASAFPNMGRWDFTEEMLIDSHPATGDTGVTGNDVVNKYYGRDIDTQFGSLQRSLCNKCHVKD